MRRSWLNVSWGTQEPSLGVWNLENLLSYLLLRGRTRDVLDVNCVGRHNGVGGGSGVICVVCLCSLRYQ